MVSVGFFGTNVFPALMFLPSFVVLSGPRRSTKQSAKTFFGPPVVFFHLVYFFGEASMGVNHPAYLTSDRNPAMSALLPKADIRD